MSPKRTVAIIVEHDVTRRLVSHVLAEEGFEVIEVDKPTIPAEYAGLERADTILLDAHLKLANSYVLCRELSSRREVKGARIVMFGNGCTSTERLAGLLAGADDFISGPFDYKELLSKLNRS